MVNKQLDKHLTLTEKWTDRNTEDTQTDICTCTECIFFVRTDVELRFRTGSSEGVFMYIEHDEHKDFFGVEMREGRIRLAFDAGSGRVEVTTNEMYNDGEWHTVSCLYCIYKTLPPKWLVLVKGELPWFLM